MAEANSYWGTEFSKEVMLFFLSLRGIDSLMIWIWWSSLS